MSYKAKDFTKAIKGSGGIITTISKRVGCSWNTAKKYIDDHPTVKQAYAEECESVLDMAEGVLIKNIQGGDSGDAKWYLTRKGKDRGYVERSQHEISGRIDVSKLTDEELHAIIKG